MVVRGRGRRYGAALAAASLAWVALAVLVVIPRFNDGRGSAFVDRYATLGDDGGDVARTLLTRPWEAAEVAGLVRPPELPGGAARPARLPVAAGAAAGGRGPARGPHQRPVGLVPAVLDRVPVRRRDRALPRRRGDPRARLAARAGRPALARRGRSSATARWPRRGSASCCCRASTSGRCRGGAACRASARTSASSSTASTTTPRAAARAVALIPDDVPVSAGNLLGAHLSERERILTFPAIGEARVGGRSTAAGPTSRDRLAPAAHAAAGRAAARPAGHAPGASTRTASWCSGASRRGGRA